MTSTRTLVVLDHAVALFFLTPTVVTLWRGVWLFETRVLPSDPCLSAWCSFFLGHLPLYLMTLAQDRLSYLVAPLLRIVAPAVSALYALATVSQWRAVWTGLDALTEVSVGSGLRGLVLSFVLLCLLRSLPSAALVPPFYLQATPTNPKRLFSAPTWFRAKESSSPWRFALDTAFSVFVVQSTVVLLWRSAWLLTDLSLYPRQPTWVTVVASLLLGCAMTLSLYLAQNTVSSGSCHLKGLPRILFQDLWHLSLSLAAVNVWRGVWYALDLFMDPRDSGASAMSALVAAWTLQAFFGPAVVCLKGLLLDSDLDRQKMANMSISFFCDAVKKKRKLSKRKPELIHSKKKELPNIPLLTISECIPVSTQV